ncbi:MAG: IclR family transcriptional regulator [Dethiosulfovibrio peptidovorans]|nr:MAG: IclR family transcriptional regulator [Dethiosulfovibrio peptidovorans]
MVDRRTKLDAVDKVVTIMDELCASSGPLSIREIERKTGVPRSTAHRFIASLERREWIHRDGESDRYRPGIRFFLLQRNDSFYEELVRIAHPIMERLTKSTKKTAIMSVLERDVGLCLHSVEPPMSMKFVAHKGMKIPLDVGATGKVLLAFAPERIRNDFLNSLRAERRRSLKTELDEIREQGYAFSREEWISHAGDISVPIWNTNGAFVAQLGIAGLVSSFDDREQELTQQVKEAAGEIGQAL